MSDPDEFSCVTDATFDDELAAQVGRLSPEALLAIPGIYEILREELNNSVLDELINHTHP